MARRYELVDGTSKKFWEISLQGKAFTARWGRIGTDGQSKKQTFASATEAAKAHDKLCAEKEKKGYGLVGGATPVKTAARPAKKPAKIAGNEELESALAEKDDAATWAVYSDWLQEQGEPWGEVIAQAAKRKPAAVRELEKTLFAGLVDGGSWTWKHGVLETARFAPETWDAENPMEQAVARVLAHAAGRLVRKLTLGLPPRHSLDTDWHMEGLVAAIVAAGPLPLLAVLDMSPDARHMDQDSWRRIGDLHKLWKAAPRLRELRLKGALGTRDSRTALKLAPIEAPLLETLVFESGGLDIEAPRAVGAASLPRLRHLELWFGAPDYGCTSTLESLAGILDGNGLPALTWLGLMNSEFADDLPALVAKSKILPRLTHLDLSMGTMYEKGARALIANAKAFRHLEELNLDDNFISDADRKALAKALPNAELGRQKVIDGEPDDAYSRYATVGE